MFTQHTIIKYVNLELKRPMIKDRPTTVEEHTQMWKQWSVSLLETPGHKNRGGGVGGARSHDE